MSAWEGRLSGGKRLGEKVTSRAAGFVTQVPKRMVFVFAAIRVKRGKGSFQMTCESKIQPKEKPQASAWRVRLRIRSMEMSGLMVMPKSMETRPPQSACWATGSARCIKTKYAEKLTRKPTNHA